MRSLVLLCAVVGGLLLVPDTAEARWRLFKSRRNCSTNCGYDYSSAAVQKAPVQKLAGKVSLRKSRRFASVCGSDCTIR